MDMKESRIACSMALVLWTVTMAHSQEAWLPKPPPPGTPEKPENVRIVKFGIEYNRQGDGHVSSYALSRYRMSRDPKTGKYLIRPGQGSGADTLRLHDFDVDGDGRTDDDTVLCHPFDLSPDNPLTINAPFSDTSVGSQRMYGAMVCFQANDLNPLWTEEGVNDAETGGGMQPVRNLAYHNETFRRFSPFRMYLLGVWQKFDFGNGGDKYRVSFNEKSELRHQPNRYYMGIEGFRWVVRNGTQFYISEYVYHGTGIHVFHPVESRWAKYYPTAPYKGVDFEPKDAKFEEVKFDDVTAIGYLMFKHKLSTGYVGYKWYAFEGEGVVHRPAQPSQNMDMTTVEANGSSFYMTTCEVPYLLWRKVHRLARYNGFAGPRGFVFDAYGDMGSMAFPDLRGNYQRHKQNEPVTNITFADALAWCNALSQQETKTPCYYVDPEFKHPYRDVLKSSVYLEKFKKLPVIYVNWAADGYRLPTQEEWLAAWKKWECNAAIQPLPTTTVVGTLKSKKGDFYDLAGNVWEMVWNHGSSLDLSTYKQYTVMGGDFRHPDKPESSSASAYGDKPFMGHPTIGFRMVRREPGLPAPKADGAVSSEAPSWNITRDTLTAANPSRQFKLPVSGYVDLVSVKEIGHSVGKYEVTYSKWKPVYDWAVANGYEFDCTGEMGSMAYWGWGSDWQPGEHSPDEPVTGITHYDVVVWLNALSEIEGRKPVIYQDVAFQKLFKKSYLYRSPQIFLGENGGKSDKGDKREDRSSVAIAKPDVAASEIRIAIRSSEPLFGSITDPFFGKYPYLYQDPSANGYRMPSGEEFQILLGSLKPSVVRKDLPDVSAQAWLLDEANLTTHPVGAKQANELGLYDIIGNVNEMADIVDKHPNVSEKIYAYVQRVGGGFFDPTYNFYSRMFEAGMARANCRGLPYPDTGFRPLQQKGK